MRVAEFGGERELVGVRSGSKHLPAKKNGKCERSRGAGLLGRTMKHARNQLELFSRRRSRRTEHLPALTVRKSSRVPHETRPEVTGPIHVVWRIRRGLPGLRTPRGLRRLERALRKGKERDGFALLHYSIQQDHIHLMVEVKNRRKLSKGLQALGIRLAKSLNSLWRRKAGTVFAERYFAVALEGWRQIWRTVRYILNNGRKHGSWTVKSRPDPYSSGRWYLPWRQSDICRPLRSSPVMGARGVGYLPYIDIDDVPGPRWCEFPLGITAS